MEMDLDLTRYEGHTPGPWSVYDQGVDDGPEYGAHIQSADPIYDWVVQNITNRADARLIADAPLLLAEVRRLRAVVVAAEELLCGGEWHDKYQGEEALVRINALRQSHARLLAAAKTSPSATHAQARSALASTTKLTKRMRSRTPHARRPPTSTVTGARTYSRRG